MLRSLGLGAILYGFWLLLSGHYTPLLLGLGAASCILVVYIARRMDVVDEEGLPLQVGARFLVYLPWLLKEVFLSNVAMARTVLDPRLPIRPKLQRYPLPLETDLGRVIFGNSVTLTPGTVTTAIDGGTIEIHVLSGEDPDTTGGRMSRRVSWVEGR
ncbi:MAG: Na+/H+ antiporter subunit E [Gemmatimonadota bacterium]|nr:Na+/H+ antiporter subunit E [Gemmatimonadota bacterium]